MRVLVVLGVPPLVEGQAQGRTAVGLIRGLVAHGLDVRSIAARAPSAPAGFPPTDLPVDVVDVEPPRRGWRARGEMLTDPLGLLGHGEFAERVVSASREVDVVHLEEVSTAPLARLVQRPAIVHLHYRVERDRSWPAPWRKDVVSYFELVRAERRAIGASRFLQASSPIVAGDIRRLAPQSDVTVAPLCLDPTHYSPAVPPDVPTAGMIGTAWWPPTKTAMERLVRDVWPLVRRGGPDARLAIAGRGTDTLFPAAPAGVEVEGEVEESAAFLSRLSVLLYPVSRGSGMKVKVIEALACGVPVVTTPEGAEGIGPHEGVIVERDNERLAGAAIELMFDRELRARRAAAARNLFLERFAPAPATEPLLAAYERMLRKGNH
jgi:glycosyltransferase involved in cell wall biosynthesis